MVVTAILYFAAGAQSAPPVPIKLDLQPQKSSVKQGSSFECKLLLRDANNALAKSPKDLAIDIRATDGSGIIHTETVHIKAGEETQTFTLTAKVAGILKVLAEQPELLQGGAYVNVRNGAQPPKPPAIPPTTMPLVSSQASALSMQDEIVTRNEHYTGAPPHAQATSPHKPVVPPTPQPRQPLQLPIVGSVIPGLQLWTMPQRKLLADGKDSATIFAFLDNPASTPIQILFRLSDGKLLPASLLIDAGQETGQACLTADHVGTVTVAFLGSNPKLSVSSGGTQTIMFSPVITSIHVAVSPPIISMFDQSNVIVTLLDSNAMPIQTDEDRHISLSFASGQGHLKSTDLLIKAGQSEATTMFFPTDKGTATVSASTLGLFSQQSDLHVTWPLLLLTLSLLGGAIGGTVAFFAVKEAKWWRIAIGPVVGLALYWGCIFIGLAHMLPSEFVLNPFSAFVLGMVGGWLGTQVFALLFKSSGFPQGS